MDGLEFVHLDIDWTRLGLCLAAAPPALGPPQAGERKSNAAAKRRENRELAARGEGLPHGQNPLTSEVEYTPDELEFSLAMERYRRQKRRPYPTNREVLAVLKSLGYRKCGTGVK